MGKKANSVLASNRKARHDYTILDVVEAGIVLLGSEVKSLRNGRVSLEEAYARVKGDEVWLVGCDIAEYVEANQFNHNPRRPRKLLLHRRAEAGGSLIVVEELDPTDSRLLAIAELHGQDPSGLMGGCWVRWSASMAWDRAEREDAHDLAGPRLSESLVATRAQLVLQVQAAASQFNEAVVRYNHAIAQFPAVLLAWVFGFKSGKLL